MNRIDFSQLGGFPLDQDVLAFLQTTFASEIAALAAVPGVDPLIISGMVDDGSNVGNGWILVDGEIIPFVGGAKQTNIAVRTTTTALEFEDSVSRTVLTEKYAEFGTGAQQYAYASLVRYEHALMGKHLPYQDISVNVSSYPYDINGTLYYRINPATNELHLKGVLIGGDGNNWPSGAEPGVILCTLPVAARPSISTAIQAGVTYSTNPWFNAQAILYANGQLVIGLERIPNYPSSLDTEISFNATIQL